MSLQFDGCPTDGHRLNLAEAARHLDMSVRTVGRWARSGRIPSALAREGAWLFWPEDVNVISVSPAEPS